MTPLTIFLCSSIVEFSKERQLLTRYVSELNRMLQKAGYGPLYLHKCEHMDNAVTVGGLQAVYDADLCRSDLVLFLFGKTAGAFTCGELCCAAEHFGERRQEHIRILCTENPRSSTAPSLQTLATMMERYQLEAIPYHHLDSAKLVITRWLLEQMMA